MRLAPYLAFNGDCRDAFTFYHQVLGGELVAMIGYEDMPMDGVSEEWRDRIMHARLVFGDQTLMGGDAPPTRDVSQMSMCVSVEVDTPDAAEQIFAALSEGGAIDMAIEPQPWSKRFGMLTDRFGIPWMVNCSEPVE